VAAAATQYTTVSPSFSPSPTVNATLTAIALSASPTPAFAASGMPRTVLAPCPVKQGDAVILYYSKAPSQSSWRIYNMAGELVSTGAYSGQEQAQWSTSKIAPGIYLARLEISYSDGSHETLMQKIAVVR
jgi:hypothetical protein